MPCLVYFKHGPAASAALGNTVYNAREKIMPLFAYACKACGNSAEILVRGGESPACPKCESNDLEKQMSRFAPMHAGTPEPVSCGAPQCCRMQGGGCMN